MCIDASSPQKISLTGSFILLLIYKLKPTLHPVIVKIWDLINPPYIQLCSTVGAKVNFQKGTKVEKICYLGLPVSIGAPPLPCTVSRPVEYTARNCINNIFLRVSRILNNLPFNSSINSFLAPTNFSRLTISFISPPWLVIKKRVMFQPLTATLTIVRTLLLQAERPAAPQGMCFYKVGIGEDGKFFSLLFIRVRHTFSPKGSWQVNNDWNCPPLPFPWPWNRIVE